MGPDSAANLESGLGALRLEGHMAMGYQIMTV